MVSRATLNELTSANRALSEGSKRALRQLFAGLPTGDPYATRDALLEAVPAIVDQYGDLTASVAMEWFEDVYGLPAALGSYVDAEQVEASVRYRAGHLFEDNPALTLAGIANDLDKFVKQPGRDSLLESSRKHGLRFARVPKGKTCSFCLMLASRGAVYVSEETAGKEGSGNRYHGGNCDCSVMPVRVGEEYPDGYDPDDLYAKYRAATDVVGTRSDPNAITFELRRMFPDLVTDGVHTH